ncbi:MAG: hypothetical protein PHQ91_11605 [Thermoanaerobaculaceae bacterium]|nr:hypothetical protein [Thermoanaerobaculaceae bacterium]
MRNAAATSAERIHRNAHLQPAPPTSGARAQCGVAELRGRMPSRARLRGTALTCAWSASLLSLLLAAALSLLVASAAAQTGPIDARQAKTIPASDFAGGAGAEAAVNPLLAPLRRPAWSPHIDDSVSPALRFRLVDAYQLALGAVRTRPTCGALFRRLGAVGEESLAHTVYRGGGEVGACLRPVPAFTCVGCPQTVLCPTFLRLGTSAGATILIHEALHFAGLKERPTHPGEMSAAEITAMVKTSCHL